MKKTKRQVHSESLCWTCKNASCGCSWSREFKPVKGWKAIATIINSTCKGGKVSTPSYCVIECPEFIKDTPKDAVTDEQWRRFLMAVKKLKKDSSVRQHQRVQ